MSLIEHRLWGDVDKVEQAIKRLRTYEPEEGYYLAFSGGKDSVTILRLAEMAGVQFDAHYNITTVDPPELVKFIKEQHPDVERHRPEMSMFRYILRKKFWPPMRQQRWCCRLLKERGGKGHLVVTGVRWAESRRRAQRRMTEQCYRDGSTTYLHPIIDWTDEQVWEFIHEHDIPYCSLYDEGFKRLGCVLCPMQAHPEQDMRRWPQFEQAYRTTFARLIEVRKDRGMRCDFETGDEMFEWWIDRRRKRPSPDQMVLFE